MNTSRNTVKQFVPTEVKVGCVKFLIHPFPAFKAANISGELISLVSPVIGGIISMLPAEGKALDVEIEDAAPHLATAFSSINGNKVEVMLRKLLVDNQNVVVMEGDPEYLTEDLANNLFCGETQLMYVLAYHVIRSNFSGFFGKIGNLSGKQNIASIMKKMGFPDTAPLTQANSVN